MRSARFDGPGAVALASLVLLLARAGPAPACSICRCGDAAFNALGPDVYKAGAFRLALDWDRVEKESAVSEDAMAAVRVGRVLGRGPLEASAATGRDHEVENRFTATASYSFGETVNVVARVPWSHRRLTTTDFAEGSTTTSSSSNLSDPELQLFVRLWAAPFEPGLGRRGWVSVFGGVKTPWGRNDLSEGGVRLDEHLQSGTGSTDAFLGLAGLALLDESSALFLSAQVRRTGSNGHGYRYGNAVLANAAVEHKLGKVVDAVVELNFRHVGRDRIDDTGTLDTNTGGSLLYLSPRLLFDLGGGLVARAGVQIPVARSLYGDQTEKAVVTAGLTFLF